MNEADVLRVIVSLILILMVILAGAWIVRRGSLGRSGSAQAVRVSALQNLGGRAWVAIVEVEDARLVVGVTAQQVTLLHTLPPAPESSQPPHGEAAPPATGFASAFTRAMKRR